MIDDTPFDIPLEDDGSNASLRRLLTESAELHGLTMDDLTVLAMQNDPFRIDTPRHHRDGRWLADNADDLGLGGRTIHIRGLHYALIGRIKPDGKPYTNTDKDWSWLHGKAAKAARWLGYIQFDQIVDQRNSEPEVQPVHHSRPRSTIEVTADNDIIIPDISEFMPTIGVDGFEGIQPYRIVLFAEKSSLEETLDRAAWRFNADKYVMTGELSDTRIHRMASDGAADGRPMVVLCFCDADPAGWQMPISIARKLQAFQTCLFPDLEFEVRRAALTPAQVREYALPSTPLKPSEWRGDRWREATGLDQTEIDALASLQPEVLERITTAAIAPFFDADLEVRVLRARLEWQAEAERVLAEAVGSEEMDRRYEDATRRLGVLQEELIEISDLLEVDTSGIELPELVVPKAVRSEGDGKPLISSAWPFTVQSLRLVASKEYLEVEDD